MPDEKEEFFTGEKVYNLRSKYSDPFLAEKGFYIEFTNSLLKRPRHFATPAILLESALGYFKWVDSHPLKKHDVIKAGEAVGTNIYINCMRPYSWNGLMLATGCSAEWYRLFRSDLNKKREKGDLTEEDEAYLTVLGIIDAAMYQQKFDGAASGLLKESIISKDLGLVEKHVYNTSDNGTKEQPEWVKNQLPEPPKERLQITAGNSVNYTVNESEVEKEKIDGGRFNE